MKHLKSMAIFFSVAFLAACAHENNQVPPPAEPVTPAETADTAAEPVVHEDPALAQHVASGSNLDIWSVRGANEMAPHPDGLLATSSETTPTSTGTIVGVHTQVSDEFELAVSGNRIKVTATVKAASENGAEEFAIAYSTNEVGNSGWRRFEAPREMRAFSFEYDVNEMREGRGDFVGIWADTSGQGRSIVVESIVVEKLPAETP